MRGTNLFGHRTRSRKDHRRIAWSCKTTAIWFSMARTTRRPGPRIPADPKWTNGLTLFERPRETDIEIEIEIERVMRLVLRSLPLPPAFLIGLCLLSLPWWMLVSPSQPALAHAAGTGTNRPVVGVLTQPAAGSSRPQQQYIAASYVKYVESGGARVVPILYPDLLACSTARRVLLSLTTTLH